MIELYDCTLREGEQAAGASFNFQDRIKLFSILDDFGFDFIELGWPLASEEIFNSFKECKKIAKKSKIVAFGSTSIDKIPSNDLNLNSIVNCGADYACIFGKTWLDQVEKQLRITPQENIEKISSSIAFLKSKNIHVFYEAEHFFDGFISDPDYALETLKTAIQTGAERIILCDTNGGILPQKVEEIVKQVKSKFPNAKIGIHFHNDSGLALANALVSLPYITQIQGTINGTGERVGNLNFSEFLPIYSKKLNQSIEVDLKKLKQVNESSFHLAGLEIPESRPFVGNTSFLHKGGVHIDATNKGASYEHEIPEDFGNKRIAFLNTLGGSGSVINVAAQFGHNLDKKDPEVKFKIQSLFSELKNLENQGYKLGALEAEQYLLIKKYFSDYSEILSVQRWHVETEKKDQKEKSKFSIECAVDNKIIKKTLETEGGPIDAAYKTLQHILSEKYPQVKDLKISDFHVSIARKKAEESTVRTAITFQNKETFETVGVDQNLIQSAIEAIVKGFNYYVKNLVLKRRT